MSADIGIGILVGAGVLFTIVAGTYVMAYFADTLCSTPDVERVSSPVSNMAGLWGMSLDERTKILQKVFQTKKTIRDYHGNPQEQPVKKDAGITAAGGASKEIEMTEINPAATATEHSSTASSNITEMEGTDDRSANDTPFQEQAAVDLEMGTEASSDIDNDNAAEIVAAASREEQITMGILQTKELNAESLETMCAICLVEYDNGDRILHGTGCSHYFHISCIMEWMEKGHDHCPFCREPMLSPQDMRAAATEALGRKRVEELSCRCTPPMEREAAPDVPVVAPVTMDSTPGDGHSVATAHSNTVAPAEEDVPLHSSNENDIESATTIEVETSRETPQNQPETAVDEVKIDMDAVPEQTASIAGPDSADVKSSEADATNDPKPADEDVEA